ncbi:MAG: 30S ribosome-binding factor RbfA [Dehalococcoidia bacterium]
MSRRTQRLNDLLREELGQLLLHQVRDPRLSGVITVTSVEVASDLSLARVFISALGGQEEKAEAMKGMTAASGYLRRELAQRLSLRRMPRLEFYRDDSIQEGVETLSLIQKVSGEVHSGGD